MTQSSDQNIWFGVAMFLLGLIVGAILSMTQARGISSLPTAQVPSPSQQVPSPQAPQKVDVTAEILGIAVETLLHGVLPEEWAFA